MQWWTDYHAMLTHSETPRRDGVRSQSEPTTVQIPSHACKERGKAKRTPGYEVRYGVGRSASVRTLTERDKDQTDQEETP
jgi:hypothetical protein